jgi:hypothetical protein
MGRASCVCFRMLLGQLHCRQEYLCAGARGHEVLHVEKAWEDFFWFRV